LRSLNDPTLPEFSYTRDSTFVSTSKAADPEIVIGVALAEAPKSKNINPSRYFSIFVMKPVHTAPGRCDLFLEGSPQILLFVVAILNSCKEKGDPKAAL
jgi:hypothetical protein